MVGVKKRRKKERKKHKNKQLLIHKAKKKKNRVCYVTQKDNKRVTLMNYSVYSIILSQREQSVCITLLLFVPFSLLFIQIYIHLKETIPFNISFFSSLASFSRKQIRSDDPLVLLLLLLSL